MRVAVAAGVFVLMGAASAQAHVALDQSEAVAGTSYKAVMRVGHGCAGSPTTAIRVRIPDGVVQVKPMPKPGWTLKTTTVRYGRTIEGLHGARLTDGVREIMWSGGSLPDAWYDEFVFVASLPDTPGKTLLFPVLQSCERGSNDWSQDPTRSSVRATHPAPWLLLTRGAGLHPGH